jgi:hypothetical protein
MEYISDAGSDKDKQMKNSFESFADKKEESKDKKKKKGDARTAVFAKEAEDKQPEKRGNIFEPKKAEDEADKEEIKEEAKTNEVLADDESKLVVEHYAELRGEDLQQELQNTEPNSPEEAEVLANIDLIEAIEEAGATNEISFDQILAEAEARLEPPEAEPDDSEDDTSALTAVGSSGGGSTPPPKTPSPSSPMPSPPPLPPIGGVPLPGPSPLAGNALPANPNVLPPRYKRGADLLVGGVIGYLIGRRGGRIRTEARLVPIQEKLEKEVKDLHAQIAVREERIRSVAREKAEQSPEPIAPKIVERLQARREQKLSSPETAPLPPLNAERLARVIVPKPEVLDRPKAVETLTVPELLQIAQKIEVEGTSVRKMYETGRLDAFGLRRVVREYMHGGQYEKRLAENLRSVEVTPEFLPKQQGKADDSGLSGSGAYVAVRGISRAQNKWQAKNLVGSEPSLIIPREPKKHAAEQTAAIAVIVTVVVGLGLLFFIFS